MGKSTVLRLFGELGAATLKADDVVDTLLRERDVMARLAALLGPNILGNGGLDKAKVAALIFGSRELREAVEAILHPLVIEKIDAFAEDLRRRKPDSIAIVEVPLIYEKGLASRFDRTVTVFTETETAILRREASGVDPVEARARMESQMPICEKVASADFTVDNGGTLEETRAKVEALYEILLRQEKETRVCA